MIYNSGHRNLWMQWENNKCGIFDSDAQTFIVPQKYRWILFTDSPDLWWVKKKNRWGLLRLINNDDFMVSLTYDWVKHTKLYNMFIVKEGKKWGIYNTAMASLVSRLEYDHVQCTDDPMVFITRIGDKKDLLKIE